MGKVRLLLSALLTATVIVVPAVVVTLFLGWQLGTVIAIFMALGVLGGRWVVAWRNGGTSTTGSSGSPRARTRQSKGARGGRRRDR